MPVARLDEERLLHVDEPWPGGESYRDVVRRTRAFLDDLRAGWDGRRVVVVAHSANRFALDHLLKGEPLELLVVAPFDWRPGWEYELEPGLSRPAPDVENSPGISERREKPWPPAPLGVASPTAQRS